MKKFNQLSNILKIIKIAIGSCMAILIAQYIGVQYSASAGIITLLSIQDTKKATISIALKRGAGFFIALLAAGLSFYLLGYNPIAFGVFLLIFVSVCIYTGLQDGISMCAVLVTHFLVEKSMSFYWIKNEALLMLIGTGIAILLNSYMPRFSRQIKEKQRDIETELKLILKGISTFLIDEEYNFQLDYDFNVLDNQIDEALKQAYEDRDNILRYEIRYYIDYMEMRKSQSMILNHMFTQVKKMKGLPEQAKKVAAFIDEIIMTLHESNNAVALLGSLHELKDEFRLGELPQSREEFEDRAILYSLLNNIEQFLVIKRTFAEKLTQDEKEQYWT